MTPLLPKKNVTVVLGAQWGDEGKGKIVDCLAEDMDIIVRAGGGANAGHTIHAKGKEYVFHLIPSGILWEGKICIIGNGCVVHLPTLLEELSVLREAGIDPKGRLFISDRAHLLFEHHILTDRYQEDGRGKKIGTTCRGIGPAYEDKIARRGIRAGQLLGDFSVFSEKLRKNAEWRIRRHGFEINFETEIDFYRNSVDVFKGVITDTVDLLHKALKAKKRILIEGAQGSHLDIDFGTYPYVTSSNTTTCGACAGSGIPPRDIGYTLGILKAYTTRVGSGPFPSEIPGELGEKLREKGHEYGATTGRPRRCGWLDIPVAQHSARISGIDAWNITKLDVLSGFETLKVVTEYHSPEGNILSSFPADLSVLEAVKTKTIELPGWQEDISACRSFAELPKNAQYYCREIERLTEVPIHSIGVGPGRDDLIFL
ncbi:adenylosuccinate synthase [Candidatus Peregrinibacteria bacterium]|nr:MAG: adenylosuccinate synthase [Candidatus Peregrinibacteria bacterium]